MSETEKQFSNYFVTTYHDEVYRSDGHTEFVSVEKGIRAEKLGELITTEINKRQCGSGAGRLYISSIQYLGDV